MPRRAKRPCKFGCCPVLVDSGYCNLHQQKIADRHRQEQNEDPLRKFYKNKRWDGTRIVILGRDPVCKQCHLSASTVVHHIIDARVWVGNGNDFYDADNLLGWCKPCHDAHTAVTSGFAGSM
jgi:5-methylcytosine-specific restriction enzyme A